MPMSIGIWMRVAKDKKATDAYDGNIYKLELGDCGKPISESRRGEQGDEYYVKLNIVKYELEHHIGKKRWNEPLIYVAH